MLDYDSMRSKVKRLTEKPDKDPAKLPRTEKEQDMVSLSDFLRDDSPSGSSSMTVRESSASMLTVDTNADLEFPSPPKALNGIRQRLGFDVYEDETEAGAGTEDNDLMASPSRGRRTGRTLLARTSSIISSYSSIPPTRHGSDDSRSPVKDENLDVSPARSTLQRPSPEEQSFESDVSSTIRNSQISRSSSIYSAQSSYTMVPACDSGSTHGATWPRQNRITSTQSTPFFEPSELEDIMAPLKADFMRKHADKLKQAKVAYDQLNEQLMSELPQLIDLRYEFAILASESSQEPTANNFHHNRVPYLDPTFEALVKIQLRFCAEAYSRMAQVQQYLDASTRDQYASGDLDARVEDVLGQIRELSIAGTV